MTTTHEITRDGILYLMEWTIQEDGTSSVAITEAVAEHHRDGYELETFDYTEVIA